jgi:hypothetical protein
MRGMWIVLWCSWWIAFAGRIGPLAFGVDLSAHARFGGSILAIPGLPGRAALLVRWLCAAANACLPLMAADAAARSPPRADAQALLA